MRGLPGSCFCAAASLLDKKLLLVSRSVDYCRRNFLWLEELFKLTNIVGGPFWYPTAWSHHFGYSVDKSPVIVSL